MSLPTFLLPSAKEGSNFKSGFEIIIVSEIIIVLRGFNMQNVLVLDVDAKN